MQILKLIIKKIKIIFLIIIEKFLIEIKEYRFSAKERLKKQSKLYNSLGMSRSKGLKKLNTILRKISCETYNEDQNMSSEHLIIFAALSIKNKGVKSILEIGTYDGYTTSILSKLFPLSQIYTIDLNDDDEIFIESYNRNNKFDRKKFIQKRNKLLGSCNNVKFIQTNSLAISKIKKLSKKFELIWIDGAHGYPVVCADITNAISLSGKDTIIICDDVLKIIKNSDHMYNSQASFETLESFANAGIIKNNYFYKRIGKKHLKQVKYISYSQMKNLKFKL